MLLHLVFFSNKTITCGEGGMLTTNSKEIFEKAKNLKNLAYGKVQKFIHDDIGFNYRLPNISAAIGLAQLEKIDKVFEEKDRIYNRYKKNLKDVKGIIIPKVENWAKYIMWVFNLCVDKNYPLKRDELVSKLKEKNIETRNAFVPISYQDFLIKKYKLFDKDDCPNANVIMNDGFYLPSGNIIPNNDIDFICEEIIKLGKKLISIMNFAIIGVGSFGLKRAQAIKNSKKGKLLSFFDPSKTNADNAEKLLKAKSCTLEEILEDKKIDSICICTPNKFHKKIIIDGLKSENQFSVKNQLQLVCLKLKKFMKSLKITRTNYKLDLIIDILKVLNLPKN